MLFAKAVAALTVAGAAGVAGHSELAGHSQTASTDHVYIVQSGDTLSTIAGRFCGNPGAYPALARASGISNPNVIYAGQRIVLSCGGRHHHYRASGTSGSSSGSSSISGSSYAQGSANIPATSRIYSFAGMERIWIAAGGSPSRAYTAACIASRESSGRSWVVSPTNDWGLWQIHDGGYTMTDPFANAQRAIAMSNNGSDWSQWATHGLCGV
jgi:LysM repeat protein